MNAPRSNVASWGEAGRQAGKTFAQIADTTRKYSPKYGKLAELGIQARAKEKESAIAAERTVRKSEIAAETSLKKTDIKINSALAANKSKRKAGMVAAAGQAIGLGLMKDEEAPPATKAIDYSATEKIYKDQMAAADKEEANIKARMAGSGQPDASTTSTPTTAKATAKPPAGSSSKLGGKPFNMSNLTNKDYSELAYAVSSEAALGTNDEFGVAANILTRLSSGKYGNSISEIIRAPGQYEGVYTGKSRYSPEIASRLSSEEGRKKIGEYYKQLAGRTEFKGQTMLQNRVAAEDPMFDPKGNFYHYAGQ